MGTPGDKSRLPASLQSGMGMGTTVSGASTTTSTSSSEGQQLHHLQQHQVQVVKEEGEGDEGEEASVGDTVLLQAPRSAYSIESSPTKPVPLLQPIQPSTELFPVHQEGIHVDQPTIEEYFHQSKFYPVPLVEYHLPSTSSTSSSGSGPPRNAPVVVQQQQDVVGTSSHQQHQEAGPSGIQQQHTSRGLRGKKGSASVAKSFACHACRRAFSTPDKLNRHQQTHTGASPYKCDQCKKTFTSKFKLVRHALIHSDRKPFSCSVCDRQFHRKDHLKNHIKVHSPQKEVYTCNKEGCKKQYTSYLSYRKHLAVHSAEAGNLTCQICYDRFQTKEEIVYHLKVHAGSRTVKNPSEKKFTCDYCERRFFTKKDVRRHLVVHTGMRDFLCQFCPQRFGRKDHLVRHIKKSHSYHQAKHETMADVAPSTSGGVVVKTEETAIKLEAEQSTAGVVKEEEQTCGATYEAQQVQIEDFGLKIFDEDFPTFLGDQGEESSGLFLPSVSSQQGELRDLGGAVLEEIEGATDEVAPTGHQPEAAGQQGALEGGPLLLDSPELLQRLLQTDEPRNVPLPGFSQTFQPQAPSGGGKHQHQGSPRE